jgi:hypothetical protein
MTIQDILNQLNEGNLSLSDLVEAQKLIDDAPDLRKQANAAIAEQRETLLEEIIEAFGAAISDVDAPVGVKFVVTRVFDEDEQRNMWDVTASRSAKRSVKATDSGDGPKHVENGRYAVMSPDGYLLGRYTSLSSAGRKAQDDRGMFARSCHGSKHWGASSNAPASGSEFVAHGYRCIVA